MIVKINHNSEAVWQGEEDKERLGFGGGKADCGALQILGLPQPCRALTPFCCQHKSCTLL
jgi:hypothetical protein